MIAIQPQRLFAVASLTQVIAKASSPETVRRACKDLLSIRLVDPYREDARPVKPPPPAVVDEKKILEALERLGGMDDYEPDRDDRASASLPAVPESNGGSKVKASGKEFREGAPARAAFTDEGVKAHLPVVKGDSAVRNQRTPGGSRRAQTKHYEPPGCVRSASGSVTYSDGPNGRAPPRATVRRY